MKSILILITYVLCINNICYSMDYDELKNKAITFSSKMINNPNDLLNILENDTTVKTELIFLRDNYESTIKIYTELVSIQKKSNYKIHEIDFLNFNGKDSSRLVIVYKKEHSLLYDIFYGWYASSCSDTITHRYEIKEEELYFYHIQTCQHTQISDLE
jgi:hypothetical protein